VILIPILCLVVGILLGTLITQPLDPKYGLYVAVAVLAGIDTICGGIRSSLEQKFHGDIFVSGFFSNIVIAFFLAWLGDRIGINLFFVCALIFGSRIFTNLSLIRRFVLTRWQDARMRKQQQQQAQSASTAQAQQQA
jgi:small basic protein